MAFAWVAAVAAVASLGAFVWAISLGRARGAAEARAAELAGQLAEARRSLEEVETLRDVLREFPHLTRELHGGVPQRRIPDVLLKIVGRALSPRSALVLMRRSATASDPSRSKRLVVTAAFPRESTVRTGTELPLGHGEIGFAAEVQRLMTRQDFEAQPAPTRKRIREECLPGFEPDLVAPLVFGDATLGAIAVEKPQHPAAARDLLRLIAHLGALALHNTTAYAEMKTTADVDGLTGILNKRSMSRILSEELLRAEKEARPISVVLFDIDHFKSYNDRNGHVAGDALLRLLATLVRENTRADTPFGRFGGEEFLMVLPGEGVLQAMAAAEKIRALVAGHAFPHAASQPLGVLSLSGGVGGYPAHARDSASLLRAADAALYAAKRAGRNRILLAASTYLGEEEGANETGFEG